MSESGSNPQDPTLTVMFVPPENDANYYLSSLSRALQEQRVDCIEYSWNKFFPLLNAIRRHEQPDVIHFHWLGALITGSTWIHTILKTFRSVVELMIIRILGISVVWTVHNLSSHDRMYPRWERFWRIFLSHAFVDHLTVHCNRASEAVREKYRLGVNTPITTIFHGHYINQYQRNSSRTQARERLGIEQNDIVYLFFGQIRPYKQVPYLIDIFTAMDTNRLKLVVAGNPKSDPLEKKIQEKCQKEDEISTTLKFIPDSKVKIYFQAANIVVLPYRDIFTSGSAILAFSFARPVIAPRLGCLRELVDDEENGFLYDPDETDGLKNSMQRALIPDLDLMGENGYEKIRQRNWRSIATRTREVYKSCQS
jgi:beta-1,4-mannosyltransferase